MHHCDIDTSINFLEKFKDSIGHGRALDCGAGIGRVTKYFLAPRFDKVDLIEPSPVLIEKAKSFIAMPNVEK